MMLKKLTRNPFAVLINDNGSRQSEIRRLEKLAQGQEDIWLNFQKPDHPMPSYCHGLALDLLINKTTTPYAVILDSDCVFLLKDWDELLIAQLNDKVKIVGATSPVNRAGNRVGGGTFPLCFAVLFETAAYRKTGISCTPGDITKGEDTCFQWPAAFKKNGYEAKIFETRNTRDFPDGPFGHLTGIEEYYFNGKIIASHFGRGSSGGSAKYWQSFKWPVVSRYLKQVLGEREKRLWMKKCWDITKAQATAIEHT